MFHSLGKKIDVEVGSGGDVDLLLDVALKYLAAQLRWNEVHEVPQLTLEEPRDGLRMVANVGSAHELELWNLDELSEADHESPRVGATGLQTLQENRTYLLVDAVAIRFSVDVQNDAGEVECMRVGVAQFIDDGVQEAQTRLIIQCLHDLLENVARFPMLVPLVVGAALIGLPVGNEEDHGADDVGVDASPPVDRLFALLHLVANVGNQLLVPGARVRFQVLSQVHQRQIITVVGENARTLLDLGEQVDLEALAEGIWLLDLRWVGSEDQVAHLDAVLGQAVHEVEVEVAEEVREVLLDHVQHAEGAVVEGLDRWWDGLAWHHVVLQEAKSVHY